MCTHERGLSIYMAENADEFSKLNSRIDAERVDAEVTAYAWGWKICAHITVRELLFPQGAESWDPTHLVDLTTYITGDQDAVEAVPEYLRHQWHQRMLQRLGANKALRIDVAEVLAAEIHVRPSIYWNEWHILEAAHALARTLDNVDACLTVLAPRNRLQEQPLHPFDTEGPLAQISGHKPLH